MSETDKKPETLEDALKVIEDLTAQANEGEKWKAMSRKNEDRAKENAEAAKERDALKAEIDALKTSKMTDEDKTAKKLADLEKRLNDAEARSKASDLAALRARVGAEKGLPPALIDRLRGEDEESIAADADALLEVAKTGDGSFDIGQGARGTTKGATTDPLAQTLAQKVGAPLK